MRHARPATGVPSTERFRGDRAVASIEQGSSGFPNRLAGYFWRFVEVVMTLAFIAMLVVMFIQVASRYALGIGVPWTDETSRFLFIAEIFLGAAIAQRYGAQIRITVLLDLLSARVRRWFDILGDVLTAAIAILVVVGAFEMMGRTQNVSASTIPVSFANLYLIQAVGLIMLIALLLKDIADAFRGAGQTDSMS
ncbi:putative small permease protein, TRAP-type C4-dicarboxylate transporter (DctQ subunit) [Aurantimonas manganoxydans SI85-9A1]|uniref:TRAP transporter small permease protein n=1 Tax=Aurantimonas manganoxydans (strain ATCC BAA-1229 / DSM 21871 / SI85-9A1) TaxID=287752 RepID=Q1YDM4_AURMS|nr:putative small permease protein, TRAP-type C4-dicarboxylate transporter (DctQ subunit) [Aurantimonas manganoxydans SI85-9A1]